MRWCPQTPVREHLLQRIRVPDCNSGKDACVIGSRNKPNTPERRQCQGGRQHQIRAISSITKFPGTSYSMVQETTRVLKSIELIDPLISFPGGRATATAPASGRRRICMISGSTTESCAPSSLISFMQTYGIQFYECHGDGWVCAISPTTAHHYPNFHGHTKTGTEPHNIHGCMPKRRASRH